MSWIFPRMFHVPSFKFLTHHQTNQPWNGILFRLPIQMLWKYYYTLQLKKKKSMNSSHLGLCVLLSPEIRSLWSERSIAPTRVWTHSVGLDTSGLFPGAAWPHARYTWNIVWHGRTLISGIDMGLWVDRWRYIKSNKSLVLQTIFQTHWKSYFLMLDWDETQTSAW